MKFLFPIDGSDCALSALDRFISLLPVLGGEPDITLMYVHPKLPYPRAVAWADPDWLKNITRKRASWRLPKPASGWSARDSLST